MLQFQSLGTLAASSALVSAVFLLPAATATVGVVLPLASTPASDEAALEDCELLRLCHALN